jgi:hypothetical protein
MNAGRRTARVSSCVTSLLVLAALAGCTSSSPSTASQLSSSVPASIPVPVATTDAQRQAAASDAASALVEAVGLPAHSQQLLQSLQSPPTDSSVIPEYTVTASRSYEVSGSLISTMSYIWAHPPAGFTACCGDGSDGYIAFEGSDTVDYGIPDVLVDGTSDGDSVLINITAQVVWKPVRTAAEYIPDTVISATLDGWRREGDRATANLTPRQTQVLADQLNAAPTVAPMRLACAMGRSFSATFTTASGAIDFTLGCTGIYVTAGDLAQPTLLLSDALQSAVDGILDRSAPT